jgi:hydroxymethylbilane synthase
MIKVGTRGSKLSLAQTDIVLNALNKDRFIVKVIKTKGDLDLRPLDKIGVKGIFEKEIDQALLSHEIDIAIHSMKDLPSELPEDLIIATVPKRESPNDVLISLNSLRLNELKSNTKIGTSSLRRLVQLKYLRNDLDIVNIRGNVETRINKLLNKEYDAIILAEAGLKRLKLEHYITERFDTKIFVPAPSQGILAVVTRKEDTQLIEILKHIEDKVTRLESIAERTLLAKMNAGCRFPLGALARVIDSKIRLHACVCSIDATKRIDVELEDSIDNAHKLGERVSEELISKGALELAKEWRYEQ